MQKTYKALNLLKQKTHKIIKLIRENKKNQYILISSFIFIIIIITSLSFINQINKKYKETQKLLENENEISLKQSEEIKSLEEKIKKLNELNKKANESYSILRKQIQDLDIIIEDHDSEIIALISKNKELSATISKQSSTLDHYEKYFAPFWTFAYDIAYSFLEINGPLWVNDKLDTELVNMLKKHITAMYSRDEKAFMETILSGGPNDEWVKYYMADEKYYHAEIRIIATSGVEGFISICVVHQKEKDDKPEAAWYSVFAVKRPSGWYLVDYT